MAVLKGAEGEHFRCMLHRTHMGGSEYSQDICVTCLSPAYLHFARASRQLKTGLFCESVELRQTNLVRQPSDFMSTSNSTLPGPKIDVSPSPSALASATSSRPRRAVRLLSQPHADDSSSSDEDGIGIGLSEDLGESRQEGIGRLYPCLVVALLTINVEQAGLPTQPRQSSYSGANHTTTPPVSRVYSLASAAGLKLARSVNTSSAPSGVKPVHPGEGSHGPPSPSAQGLAVENGYQEWRNKYEARRLASTRSAASSFSTAKEKAVRYDQETSGNLRRSAAITTNDPDINYFESNERLRYLDDLGSDEDEDQIRSPPGSIAELPISSKEMGVGDFDPIHPSRHPGRSEGHEYSVALDNATEGGTQVAPALNVAEGKERLEWQSMLKSVLAGDILQTESSRIGEDRGEERFRRELGRRLWWQIRARLRRRSEEEEKRHVEERRSRIVDATLEEIESFVVKKNFGPPGVGRRLSAEDERDSTRSTGCEDDSERRYDERAALDQVTHILQRLNLVEALYPHYAAFRNAKPLYNADAFRTRVDGLIAWSTVVTALQLQLQVLQNWTGSDDLDTTRQNTTREKALVGKNRYHPLDNKAKAQAQAMTDQTADDSTFLERIMKEDNLQRTFEKRVFVDLVALVWNARQTVISYLPVFRELQLPDFQYELVRLISFPAHLIIEALKIRLDAVTKVVDPSPMVINDMVDSFRLIISLAVLIKKQYEEMVEPDPAEHWVIPPCLPTVYDAVLLDALRTFFKLLHWKLKSGSRTIYFRETEVLEAEWEFLYETAEAVPGGDLVVAEHFWWGICSVPAFVLIENSSLTNKLMVRVCNYFDSQLRVPLLADVSPLASNKPVTASQKAREDPDSVGRDSRPMSPEEMLVWYGMILDAVRMRYRKLQRFAR